MFDIGLGEILLVLFASLFIFGPDRLPQVAAQAARALRQMREMAAGARADLTDALGPELTDLGKDIGLGELRDLTNLRALDPRKTISSVLLGTGDPVTPASPTPIASPPTPASPPAPANPSSPAGATPPAAFDPDAT